jgi:hypothetical protein
MVGVSRRPMRGYAIPIMIESEKKNEAISSNFGDGIAHRRSAKKDWHS